MLNAIRLVFRAKILVTISFIFVVVSAPCVCLRDISWFLSQLTVGADPPAVRGLSSEGTRGAAAVRARDCCRCQAIATVAAAAVAHSPSRSVGRVMAALWKYATLRVIFTACASGRTLERSRNGVGSRSGFTVPPLDGTLRMS